MSNAKKISELPVATSVTPIDYLIILDMESVTTQKATISQVLSLAGTGTVSGTGTVGQLAYFSGASTISSGDGIAANSLVWDFTNNRLGIGTSAPSEKLEVAGVVYSTSGGFKFPDGSTQLTAVSGSGMAIGASIAGATEGSLLFAGVSGTLNQNNANLFWDNTNNRLGVGTSSPAVSIDSAGTIRSVVSPGANSLVGTDLTQSTFAVTHAATDQYHVRVGTAGLNQWLTLANGSGTDVLTVKNNRVAVNNTNPSYTFSAESGGGGVAIDGATSSVGGTFGTGGNLSIKAEPPTSTTGPNVFLGGSTRGDAQKNAILFQVGSTEYMRIDGDFAGHTIGNIGIGTTTPGDQLVINKNSSGGATIQGDVAGTRSLTVANNTTLNGQAALYLTNDAATDRYLNVAYNSRGFITSGLQVANQAKFLTSGAGGVLFGTLTTTQTAGDIIFVRGGTSELDQRLNIKASEVSINEGGQYVDFRVESSGNANMLFVDSDADRIGVGTSAPSQKLEVAGTISSTSGGFKFPDGSTQTTASVTSPEYITIVSNQISNLSTYKVAGGISFNASGYTTVKFITLASVSNIGLTGEIVLYNITDATTVITHTYTVTDLTNITSLGLSLPSSLKTYEVRHRVLSGTVVSDLITTLWAGLYLEK